VNNHKKFMRWRKDHVPRGDVYQRHFGDNGTLVAEVREGKKTYLVTVYQMVAGGFNKVYQNRYKTLPAALRRGYEILEAF